MYKQVINGEEVKIIVRGDKYTGKIGKIVYSMSLGSTEKHIVSFEDGGIFYAKDIFCE